jgi:VCBS repeat-containing protein
MPGNRDYALFAANAYAASDLDVNPVNEIRLPSGWSAIESVDNVVTGFSARAYRNEATREIVIAYAGTSVAGTLGQQSRDWLYGNLKAGTGASLPQQVTNAAEFYLDVANASANAGYDISLTGHSLGGGLASLISVYFDKRAVAFDPAPFQKAADSAIVVRDLKDQLVRDGYSLPAAFASYVARDYLFGAVLPSPTRQAREGNVSSTFMQGEILSLLQTPAGRIALPLLFSFNPVLFLLALNVAPIGTPQPVASGAQTGNGWGFPFFPLVQGNPVDLHSMPMLAAFYESSALAATSVATPELLQSLFTSALNKGRGQNTGQRNLINLLDNWQLEDGAWDAVAQDVQRLTGSLAPSRLKAALVQLDLAMQYAQALDHEEGSAAGAFANRFQTPSGGIQFTPDANRADIMRDGRALLRDALGREYPTLRRFFGDAERYSLQSSGAFVASATADASTDFMLGGADADQLSAGDGRDQLYGQDGTDTLVAGAGNDLLVGGAGDDTLNGGAGLDYYYRSAGDGNDTIVETRENGVLGGRIFIVSDTGDAAVEGLFLQQGTAEVWSSERGGMTLTHGGDWTLTLGDGSTLNLGADVRNGDFGIFMSNTPQAIQTDRTILGDLAPHDFDAAAPGVQTRTDDLGNIIVDPDRPEANRADQLFDSAGNDVIQSFGGTDTIDAFRGGDDRLDGGAGRDVVMGRDGNDVVIGGADGDLLRGDAGRDRIYGATEMTIEDAIAALEGSPTAQKGDFTDGGTGDDTLASGADNDALNGGGGNDLIIAGAGDDDIEGDLETAQATFDWSVVRSVINDPSGVTIYSRTYNNVAFAPLNAPGDDVAYGGAGADWAFMNDGNDWIDAGGGDDVVFGDAGADEIFGGGGADKLFGDSAAVPQALHGADYLDGGDGDDLMNGDGGDDVLFGGEGADQMFGDSTVVGGIDYLDGEGGDDVILGAGNSDTLYGGDGNDFLQGDSGTGIGDGDDVIFGEAGDDQLHGEGGNDQLDGGDGADSVFGYAGSDTLLGGAGNDLMVGDEGDATSGDADSIDAGDGDDVALGDGGDDFIAGGAGIDQLQGGDGDDTLDGGADGDVLFGEAGNDTLLGGAGDDQLIGGLGDDTMNGGDGNDVYFVFSGDGTDRIRDSSGTDFLVFNNWLVGQLRLDVGSLQIVAPDGGAVHLDDFDPDNPLTSSSIEFMQFADGSVFTTQQVIQTLGFHVQGTPGEDALSGTALGESIQALGGDDMVFARGGADALDLGAGNDYGDGGDGNDTIVGGDGNDFLAGGAGVDQLTGGLGDDRLSGGPGNDAPLDGGAGNDTYLIGAGDGQDLAVDTQGVNGIQLLGGLTAGQVTLQRSGNDLIVLVNGTTDRLTARDWFANPQNWSELGLGDGTVLDRQGVQDRLAQNQAPVLAEDTGSVTEDAVLTASGNALLNDRDPEGRALRVTTTGTFTGSLGSLALAGSGAFTYTLNNSATAVQRLAAGQSASDAFSYTATDDDPAGAASASSRIVITINGTNDAPVTQMDFGLAVEDDVVVGTGNVLANDHDIDTGAVLSVANAGVRNGTYGTLTLNADGNYAYELNSASALVQSLPQFESVLDDFTYTASDGLASTPGLLRVEVFGSNDAPVLSIPLADQSVRPGRSFSYTVPAGSFTDIDQATTLEYSAFLADGSELPGWLTFDAATQTFSGSAPSDATGAIDIEVLAADGPLEGEVPGLFASDVFTLSVTSGGGGGGGGGNGGGHGNEGVGNGEDPPPPGHDDNFNDGPGTGPGHPGAQGGNGLGHTMSPKKELGALPQLHGVQSAANERVLADHGNAGGNGNGNGHDAAAAFLAPTAAAPTLDAPAASAPMAPDAPPTDASAEIAAQLAQEPQYDFVDLMAWLSNESSFDQALDSAEIARRWSRIARYVETDTGMSDEAHAAALGWQRFADAFASANGGTPMTGSEFVGLGVGSGLSLESFRGLNEGLARL